MAELVRLLRKQSPRCHRWQWAILVQSGDSGHVVGGREYYCGGSALILGWSWSEFLPVSRTAIGAHFREDKSLPAIQQNFAEGALEVGGVLTLGAALSTLLQFSLFEVAVQALKWPLERQVA